MSGKILLVEDEAAIREMVDFTLSRAGFSCVGVADTNQAEEELIRETPDLILLDWMLPGQSGIDFARHLKKDDSTRSIPIIMLTARDAQEDKIRALKLAADDYITKPFADGELVARIEAVLRRSRPEATDALVKVGGLILDPRSHRVFATDQSLELGRTEFRLLHLFMTHPDRVYSRGQLLDLVWGRNLHVGERTVDMHVSNLRKALEPHGHDGMIQTVRGVGYRFSTRD
ncbi:MAG: phosphate regulon transcriptional regulator PhoB [Kiloniellales bacterium]|nr:phosphate regulon transcriptional regulator PhoB [Kiloniellales bacterium]